MISVDTISSGVLEDVGTDWGIWGTAAVDGLVLVTLIGLDFCDLLIILPEDKMLSVGESGEILKVPIPVTCNDGKFSESGY